MVRDVFVPRAEIELADTWRFATDRKWVGERVAFCHCLKMNWRANGVLPLAENGLVSEWHFAIARKKLGEWMAFRHELKKVCRVDGIIDFFFSFLCRKIISSFSACFLFLLFVLKIFFILNLRKISFLKITAFRLPILPVWQLKLSAVLSWNIFVSETLMFQKRFCFRNSCVLPLSEKFSPVLKISNLANPFSSLATPIMSGDFKMKI